MKISEANLIHRKTSKLSGLIVPTTRNEGEEGTHRVLDGIRGDNFGVVTLGEGRQDVGGDRNGDTPLHKAVLSGASPQPRHSHFGFAMLMLQSEALHRNKSSFAQQKQLS